MARIPLIAGNWKMNKTVAQALNLVSELLPPFAELSGVESLICPPYSSLMPLAAILEDSPIKLGAQNIYWEKEGAFTGELSGEMIREFCEYVIIGHSERRQYFAESDQDVNKKIIAAISADLIPILCVGESLAENESGSAAEVLTNQINAGLKGLSIAHAGQLVLAYEPIWAIGTGKAATPEDIDTLLRNVVRPVIGGLFGAEIAQGIRILYGGSVNAENARSYFQKEEIDGALVGGASLIPLNFLGIAQAAQK